MLAELEQAKRDLTSLSRALTERQKTGKRSCSKCLRLRGPDEFYKRRGKPGTWCKQCENRRRKVWDHENPEKAHAASRRRWLRLKADPERLERVHAQERRRRRAG